MEAALKMAPKLARKPRSKVKLAPAIVSDHLYRYAMSGVIVMAALSALLNGYANAQHATIPAAGWGMGLVIPVIILLLGKVAGLLYKRQQTRAAYLTAGTGIGLLALSVWHVSLSIAALTGSPLLLAFPMAVAIDAGFVACEFAALLD